MPFLIDVSDKPFADCPEYQRLFPRAPSAPPFTPQTIRVRVLDSSNAPVPNAKVSALTVY